MFIVVLLIIWCLGLSRLLHSEFTYMYTYTILHWSSAIQDELSPKLEKSTEKWVLHVLEETRCR